MTEPRPPAMREALYAFLDAHGIDHRTHDHPPVFRVEEGAAIKAALPGGHTKNLFLKDRRGALWLLCALGGTAVDLKRAATVMGAGRLSFGSPERLEAALGVRPGSVTPFALLNDPERRVGLVLDAGLMACDPLNFHPLANDATTAISREGFLRFLRALGREPVVADLSAASALASDAPPR